MKHFLTSLALGFCPVTLIAAEPIGRPTPAQDAQMVERVVAARKEYQASLAEIYAHYAKVGDKKRANWAADELRNYHLQLKPSYRLDILDVPSKDLQATTNEPKANELYKQAMSYKDSGFGTDYILNQRRTELLLQEILRQYPNSDKIASVAYQLGDVYSSSAYEQYERAAAYFTRSWQWRKGVQADDAVIRAAQLYEKIEMVPEAVEMYREEISHGVNEERLKLARRRLAELAGN